MIPDWLTPAIMTIVTASTPLVFAAVGEIMAEKAGVLKSVRGRRPYWWNLYITLDVMDGRSLQDPGPEAVTIK